MHFSFPRTVFFSLFVLLAIACKREVIAPDDLKKSYFPLKAGSSITYTVDSTAYSDFNNTSTLYNFELKDSVMAQISESGKEAFLINRYKRNGNQPWQYQKSFTRRLVELRAEEFEDNIRYVRFTFPPAAGKKWNANTYNTLGSQEYQFTDVHISQTINSIKFDSTAVVEQIREVNLIREDIAIETYAKNIGLVKREVKAIDKNISTGKIIRGYQYVMLIKSNK